MLYQVTINEDIYNIEAPGPQEALENCWTLHDLEMTIGTHLVHISQGIHKYCAHVYFDKHGIITQTKWGFVQ